MKKYFSVLLVVILLGNCKSTITSNEDNKDVFDWRSKDIMTSIKNQDALGPSGTCWAFASVGMLEAYLKKDYNLELDLSEQHLINTCSSAGPFEAFDYMKNTGLLTESRVPYRNLPDTTFKLTEQPIYKIKSYGKIFFNSLPNNERYDSIKSIVKNKGPLLVSMTLFEDLDKYKGGIYKYNGTSPVVAGHIVIVVGYNIDSKGKGYWICKNSWGSQWGENGYFRIYYDEAEIGTQYGIYITGVTVSGSL